MQKLAHVLAFFLIFTLCGCQRAQDFRDISGQRVVAIRAEAESPAGLQVRTYTDPAQIHRLLHALRLEKSGAGCGKLRLELRCADGSRRQYFCAHPGSRLYFSVLWVQGQGEPALTFQETGLPRLRWHRVYFPALRGLPASCKFSENF